MEVVVFLRENWQFISTGILVVLVIFSLIFKKRSNYKIFDSSITSKALTFIKEAETIFGSGRGSEKLDYVLSRLSDEFSNYEVPKAIFRSIVESILSSPQKKESSYEEVK